MTVLQRSFQTEEEVMALLSMGQPQRLEFLDRSLRGLMLTKRKNGAPCWVLKYQCPRTFQMRSIPVGAFPEVDLHKARQKGMEIIRQEYWSEPFELIQAPMAGSVGDKVANEGATEGVTLGATLGGGAVGKVVGSEIGSTQDTDTSMAPTSLRAQALRPKNSLKSEEVKASLKPNNLHAGDQTSEQQSARKTLASLPTPKGYGRINAFITLNQFHLDHYLPYIKVAKRSWGTDVSVLKNHILPMLGGYAMLDLKPFVIQEMVQALVKKGLSPSTCNRALIILRFMYNCGLKWEVLPKMENPCKNVKELALNNKKERFLNGNEISTLKLELAKSKNKFLPYIVQLLILTGCRRGEALNAQIQHFDLGRGDWVVPLPKAGKARHIPLNDLAIQTIRAAIVMKQSYNQVAKESHFLFPNPATGEPFQQIFYSWDKARKAAHIDTVRMHDLRHSFASAMVNSGMTLYDVKEILGHSNIRTTERYAHLSNSRLRQAAGAVSTFYENQDWIGDAESVSATEPESVTLPS